MAKKSNHPHDEPFLTDADVQELGLERLPRPGAPLRDRKAEAAALRTLEREPANAGAPVAKRRSGPNIPEMDRRTVAIKLRLPRAAADHLRELAERSGMTLSALVAEISRDHASRGAGETMLTAIHETIVEAMLSNHARTMTGQKHVIEELRARIARSEPKKKRAPRAG